MIDISLSQWRKFAPRCPDAYTSALFDNLDLLRDAGLLDSELRWCHFAATVFEETGDFREIRECMSYSSVSVLRSNWPSRFGHKSDGELRALLRNPHGLAEAVYGGRMGNRPGTGDAYDYRGGGWIQTTGRSAVADYCKKLGIEPSAGTLDDPVLTLKFAVLEWKEAKCNQWADENSLRKVAKAINTGSASSNVEPIGLDDRKKAFARAWSIWGESGRADEGNTHRPVGELVAKVGVPSAMGLEGIRHVVDKGTEIKSIAVDARGLMPSMAVTSSQFLGAGFIVAAVAVVVLVVVRARG